MKDRAQVLRDIGRLIQFTEGLRDLKDDLAKLANIEAAIGAADRDLETVRAETAAAGAEAKQAKAKAEQILTDAKARGEALFADVEKRAEALINKAMEEAVTATEDGKRRVAVLNAEVIKIAGQADKQKAILAEREAATAAINAEFEQVQRDLAALRQRLAG